MSPSATVHASFILLPSKWNILTPAVSNFLWVAGIPRNSFSCVPSTIQVVATLLNSEMLSSTVYWISGNMLRSEETYSLKFSVPVISSPLIWYVKLVVTNPYSFQNSFVNYFINKCLSNSFIFCSGHVISLERGIN